MKTRISFIFFTLGMVLFVITILYALYVRFNGGGDFGNVAVGMLGFGIGFLLLIMGGVFSFLSSFSKDDGVVGGKTKKWSYGAGLVLIGLLLLSFTKFSVTDLWSFIGFILLIVGLIDTVINLFSKR